jgi:putative Mn2+ efflux pump MntP
MSFFVLIAIAFGLSMDAFSVSIASGCNTKENVHFQAFRMAIWFGSFQALMPVLGWLSGIKLKIYLERVDHWIAFLLLAYVGGKMVFESFSKKEYKKECRISIFQMFLLAIATSIDAFAVGFSLSLLNVTIYLPALFIGLFTFLFCLLGFYIGKKIGKFLEKKSEVIGGIVLILIGFKILIEHLLK